MDTIFKNPENSKTSEPHILIVYLTDKLEVKRVSLYLSIYCTRKNIKSSYNNNKFKISAPIWNDPSVKIYVNKIKNRITFKIKNRYSLELLTHETVKLLRSIENKITKDKNGGNVPHLEITEVVLVPCNIVNNDYQQDSRVLIQEY